jgi:valyl-tRNA synthetase
MCQKGEAIETTIFTFGDSIMKIPVNPPIMSIPANFDYNTKEREWYKYWLENKFFESVPDERKPYTIVIPPPNVTGVLHMGHMLNNTLQDVIIRRARMQGFNACWVPGTDHASIATEAKVVAKLREEGIAKSSLTRDEFLEHAWEWTHKHGGIILEQLKRLGASCDWSREAFTMDEARSQSVIKVFIDLFNKGKIYRGYRMVNWDPQAKTTLSDEEVIHKDVNAKLYYIKYKIEGEDDTLTIATTRPETIFGDTAICINPNDERHSHLKGKRAIVPIANRSIPIIEDDYVSLEFGTGCLKVTPAHDVNDKAIGDRHNLEVIDAMNDDGTLNSFGLHYNGKDRFVVRREIAVELEELGVLAKIEDYATSVGTSERTGEVIEPRLSDQWFLKMKEIAQPALDNVMNDEVQLIPEKFKNTYRHWMENVHDWNISRQLWWGHQIPAYYYGEGKDDFVVAETIEEASRLASEKSGKTITNEDLKQDADVLDTWFSSWLWPISVFDGIRNPDNEEINYYYPTQDLITAPEILFFWVARMIIAGYEYRKEKPFSTVYLTGIVRDKQGRKMSKSLGNSPDPIGLMEKYSTDGVRVGMLLTSPAGNDLPFDEELCTQGRNFSSKIWNALRLVKGWEVEDKQQDEAAASAIHWFEHKLRDTLQSLEESFSKYRISEALMTSYKFVWDDFCSWYLEAVKPAYGEAMDRKTYEQTVAYFEQVCTLLHPFMPFITEEIWHQLVDRKEGQTLCLQSWPELTEADKAVLADFDQAVAVVNGVRNIRTSKNISFKDSLELIATSAEAIPASFEKLIAKMCNLKSISKNGGAEADGANFTFLAGNYQMIIPAGDNIDIEAELDKLRKDLEYQQGFLKSVQKKLSNERFVAGAPEAVVNAEKQKQADAEAKIKALEERLTALS